MVQSIIVSSLNKQYYSNNAPNLFNLANQINNYLDWDNAYILAQKTFANLNEEKEPNTFVTVSSQMLLTVSLLLSRTTPFPDLLTVKTFLLSNQLSARIFLAKNNGRLIEFGTEIYEGFQYFLDLPDRDDTIKTIVDRSLSAIDSYLLDINQVDDNLILKPNDLIMRAKYIDRLFPLPPSEIISEYLKTNHRD
ncbi:MAG: hypothetical protein ACFBSE_16710 [Prochloraceae cyanobacterium]